MYMIWKMQQKNSPIHKKYKISNAKSTNSTNESEKVLNKFFSKQQKKYLSCVQIFSNISQHFERGFLCVLFGMKARLEFFKSQ